VLILAPLKHVVLSALRPPSEPCSLPPYTEPLAEQAQSGLVVANELVELAAPPPPVGTDNSVGGKAVVSQMVTEPQVEAASGGDAIAMVSAERTAPPPPPMRDHEAVVPTATETHVPATMLAGGVRRKRRCPAPCPPSTSRSLP
jgi:hypothetical protein